MSVLKVVGGVCRVRFAAGVRHRVDERTSAAVGRAMPPSRT